MKKFQFLLYFVLIAGFTTSCRTTRDLGNATSQRQLHDIMLNGKVHSAMWQQNAGEFRALCYQAYNIATIMVDKELEKQHNRPLAIITDIDETIFDNSFHAVGEALKGKEFDPDTWTDWVNKEEAVPYAGSLEFFNYAASKDITIFYITNRNEREKQATINNMKKYGYPFSDNEHVLVMSTTSSKLERNLQVTKDYQVFMYLGDNLADFTEGFYKRTQTDRNALVDELAKEFGVKYIVLPNSGYGGWEQALPGLKSNGTVKEKDKAILDNVRGY